MSAAANARLRQARCKARVELRNLGVRIGIALIADRPAHHHRVILMHEVVTMEWIRPGEVSEAEEELDGLVELQARDIFATVLDGIRSGGHTVTRQNLMLFEVNMDWMLPA